MAKEMSTYEAIRIAQELRSAGRSLSEIESSLSIMGVDYETRSTASWTVHSQEEEAKNKK